MPRPLVHFEVPYQLKIRSTGHWPRARVATYREREAPVVITRIVVLLASGFGLGHSPIASGTVGSLLGVVIVLAMGGGHEAEFTAWRVLLSVVLALVAIPICDVGEDHYGRKDDGRIVADEYLTFPICMLGLPWRANPWLLLVAFVTHRLCDILKPPPARQSQALRGGIGIVTDDIVASLYALLINHVVFRYVMM